MAQNYIMSGDVCNVVLAADAVAGTPFLLGIRLAVPLASGSTGDTVACSMEGVFTVPKATGSAWTQGEQLYWDDTAKNVTTVSTSNTAIGWAFDAAASGDTTGNVKLFC
jgi:predicted RecA/RadA family phage recombinase